MLIKELFTTYWSQVTLILLALGYVIKRILDSKSKKIEINHSLFQQNRITTVNRYFAKYAAVELMWNHIDIFEILTHKLDAKEIDDIIFPPINDLKGILLELRIYFDKDDYKLFEDLTNRLISINGKLKNLYFNSIPNNIVLENNEFDFFKTDVLKKNNELMNQLCQRIRETFKS
jgi:hypothetical protein